MRRLAIIMMLVLAGVVIASALADGPPAPPASTTYDPSAVLGGGSGDGGDGTADDAPPGAETPDDGDPGTSDGSPQPTDTTSVTDDGTTQPSPTTPTTTTTAADTTTSDPVTTAPPKPSYCEATPTADVGVSSSVSGGNIVQGSMVSYSLDAFNGNSPQCSALNTSLSDQLPPQLEVIGVVTTEQGDCRVEGSVGSQLITCSFGTLSAGQHVRVGFTARVDKTGTVSNTACVESSAADPDVGDNQCSAATFTTAPATSSNTSTNQSEPPVAPAESSPPATTKSRLRLPESPSVKTSAASRLVLPGP